jgi:hypothetical protein
MRRILSSVAVAVAVALFTPLSVATSASEMTCRIPFSFNVNGRTLPPGFYMFVASDPMLIVRGDRSAAVALTRPMKAPGSTGVAAVFLKTGDRYELIETWTGDGAGREFPRADHRKDWTRTAQASVERIVIAGM